MKALAMILLCCLLFTGCSLPVAMYQKNGGDPTEEPATLSTIRIARWGEVRFTGLLALREGGRGLHYGLLDSTGVTLLQGRVESDGEFRPLQSRGVLKDSAVASSLAKALARIFLLVPDEKPCGRKVLVSLCLEKSGESGWRKTGMIWPFTLWRVSVFLESDKRVIDYHQPWLGLHMTLTMNNLNR